MAIALDGQGFRPGEFGGAGEGGECEMERSTFGAVGAVVAVGSQDTDRLDRSRRLGWFDPERLAGSRILIAGCGALGNEVAKDLVLAGAGDLVLCDMDHVVESNRNRCVLFTAEDARTKRLKVDAVADGIHRLVPEVRVQREARPLEEVPATTFESVRLVIGCLDNVAARLHLNGRCATAGIPLVDGGTLGMTGKVQVVLPPDFPCLECTANRTHLKVAQRRMSCTGGDVTYVEPPLPAEVTTTAIIAAIQVREAVKILHGRSGEVLRHLLYYDGLRNRTEIWEADVSEGCPYHAAAGPAAAASAAPATPSAGTLPEGRVTP